MSTALFNGSERGDLEARPARLETETPSGTRPPRDTVHAGGSDAAGSGHAGESVLDPDDALMLSVRTGDHAAFECLVERWHCRVLAYLTSMLGSRDDALDATQDTFIRLFTRADRHEPRGSFKAWLYRMATNIALDQIRKRRRQRWIGLGEAALDRARRLGRAGPDLDATVDATPTEATLGVSEGSALGRLLERERADALHGAVSTLPAVYRAAVVLKDLNDLGYDETAEALGVSVGTVKSRVNRGRNLLRDKLAATIGRPPGAEPPAGRTHA